MSSCSMLNAHAPAYVPVMSVVRAKQSFWYADVGISYVYLFLYSFLISKFSIYVFDL